MMKHKIIYTCTIIILIISLLSVVVSAHSGKTDSNGGHYDKSTGEYHYHHGYSAHQHTNGKCPYFFNDKTDHSSSTTNNDKFAVNGDEKMYWIIGILVVIVCFLGYLLFSKNKEIEKFDKVLLSNKNASEKDKEKIIKQYNIEKLKEENKTLQKESKNLDEKLNDAKKEILYNQKVIQNLKAAPNGIRFSSDNMPIFWKHNPDKPYGDYTVYYSSKSQVYHVDKNCAPFDATTMHVFNAMNSGRPCKKCAENFFDFSKVPDWFDNYRNF